MAKPDGRIEAGQSLKRAISAQRWNDLCDAADIVHGRRGGVTAGQGRHTKTYIEAIAHNKTGFDLEPYSAATVWYWNTPLTQSLNTIASWHVVLGPDPDLVTEFPYQELAFVIALEPIAADKFGKVAVGGLCPIKTTGGFEQLSFRTGAGNAFGVSPHSSLNGFVSTTSGQPSEEQVGYGRAVGKGYMENLASGTFAEACVMVSLGNSQFHRVVEWNDEWDLNDTKTFQAGRSTYLYDIKAVNPIRDFYAPSVGGVNKYRGLLVGRCSFGAEYYDPQGNAPNTLPATYTLAGLVGVASLNDLVDVRVFPGYTDSTPGVRFTDSGGTWVLSQET